MRIGLVDDMAWRMRKIDVARDPCVQCGELVASAYAHVFGRTKWGGYDEVVICKLCDHCGNAHDDWIARGRSQVEMGADGQYTLGWLVQVTLRSQLTHEPSGAVRSREAWLDVLPTYE